MDLDGGGQDRGESDEAVEEIEVRDDDMQQEESGSLDRGGDFQVNLGGGMDRRMENEDSQEQMEISEEDESSDGGEYFPTDSSDESRPPSPPPPRLPQLFDQRSKRETPCRVLRKGSRSWDQ